MRTQGSRIYRIWVVVCLVVCLFIVIIVLISAISSIVIVPVVISCPDWSSRPSCDPIDVRVYYASRGPKYLRDEKYDYSVARFLVGARALPGTKEAV